MQGSTDLFNNVGTGGKTVKNQSAHKIPFFLNSNIKSNRDGEPDYIQKIGKDKITTHNTINLTNAVNIQKVKKVKM